MHVNRGRNWAVIGLTDCVFFFSEASSDLPFVSPYGQKTRRTMIGRQAVTHKQRILQN